MKYTNEICQGCGRKFTDEDDIVTCPECGTPQHRECWLKEHKCVNEHLHGENFEWRPKHAPEKGEEAVKATRPCPFCGHENPVDAKECENCSQPLEMFGRSIFPPEQNGNEQNARGGYSYKPPFEVNYEEPQENTDGFNPFGENQTAQGKRGTAFIPAFGEGTVLGVEKNEFAAYVRASVPSYYKKFKKFEKGGRFSFNFAALIFGPLWFFFRKLYKEGIVFISLCLCLTMALYAPLTEATDKYYDFARQMSELQESELTEEQQMQMAERFVSMITEYAPVVYGYLGGMALINIICAFFADGLYKKKFLRDTREADEEAQGLKEMRLNLILQKGGVSFFMPLAAYFGMQALSSLLAQVFFK